MIGTEGSRNRQVKEKGHGEGTEGSEKREEEEAMRLH